MPTNTWIAASSGLASDSANWSLGRAPIDGDDVVFDATSSNNCSWDIAAVDRVLMDIGYTGLWKNTVDARIRLFDRYSGTVASSGKYIIPTERFDMHGGGTQYHTTMIKVDTAGVALNFGGEVYNLTISADCYGNIGGVCGLSVDPGVTVTLASGWSIKTWDVWSGVKNRGVIDFTGCTLNIALYSFNRSVSLGEMRGSCIVTLHAQSPGPKSLTLSGAVKLSGSLVVASAHASHTMTLDGAGYSIDSSGITIGTRGAIIGDGTIINHGDLDASAGTLDIAGQYVQAGDGTIKLGAGQAFYDLILRARAAGAALASDVTINGIYAHAGPLDQRGFAVHLADSRNEYEGIKVPIVKRLVRPVILDPRDTNIIDLESAPT